MNTKMHVYTKDDKRYCFLNELSLYEKMINRFEDAGVEEVQNGELFAYELDKKMEELIDMMHRPNREDGLNHFKALVDVYKIDKYPAR